MPKGCESALVLVALVWSVARGEDYSGAALPQYGAGASVDYGVGVDSAAALARMMPEDYGHSPDAPAQLDYKYEEEPRGSIDKATKDIIDKVTRQKHPRKMRKSRRRNELVDEDKAEPLLKNKGRRTRPRLREPPRRRRRLPRDRHHLEYPKNYHDDGRKVFDALDTVRRDTTKKILRIPRDRVVPKQFISDELDPELDEVYPNRKTKDRVSEGMDEQFVVPPNDLDGEDEKPGRRVRPNVLEGDNESSRDRIRPDVSEGDNDRFEGRLPPDVLEGENERFRGPPALGTVGGRESGRARRPVSGVEEDEEEEAQAGRVSHKGKQYRDYGGDYYDMRRVQSINNKLPSILRRTTTRREPVQEWSSTEREWSSTEREWSSTEREWSTTEREWSTTEREQSTTKRERSSTEWQWSSSERQRSPQPEPEPESTTTNDLLQLLMTARRASHKQVVPEPDTTSSPDNVNSRSSTTFFSTTITTSIPVSIKSNAELSIAERSRLSILKKAQKKDNYIASHSKKPPVLLQMTDKMPTVVMVEPRPSVDPWMRAQLAIEESPSQLEKVKRLMRRKIVSNSKNMDDLTSNWDEMVCDYIDMSLLKDDAASCQASASLLAESLALMIVLR